MLGALDVRSITRAQITELVQAIDRQGHNTTAHDCLRLIRTILEYAEDTGTGNNAPRMKNILSPIRHAPMKHVLDPVRLGEILLILERAHTRLFATRAYIRIMPMLFTRPSELRGMKWAELDGDLWIKPASTMKKRRTHLIPLPVQTQRILEELRLHTGHCEYAFTNPDNGKPISDGAAQRLKIRNGLHEEITMHGWRHTASTLLNEQGFNHDHIELQLSHVDKNTIRGTYNHAQYLEQRRDMMQRWADYLDGLKAQALAKETRHPTDKDWGCTRTALNTTPSPQDFQLLAWYSKVKSKLAFLQEERERFTLNPIVLARHTLCLIPEIPNAVDVVAAIGKALAMVDAFVMKTAHIQHVIAA